MMGHRRSPRPRTVVCAALVLVAAALLPLAAAPSGAQTSSPGAGPGLSKHDRELLAEAQANGEPTVSLLIAARQGANRQVARGVQALGGTVDQRDDDVSYLRATVPTGNAEAAGRLAGIEAVDVDEIIPLDDPRPGGATNPNPFPAPDAGTPRANPYMPIGDTGAAAFLDANPTWDGRGVTVGVLDTGVTLDHPALQTTTTGAPKIIDWVTYTPPAHGRRSDLGPREHRRDRALLHRRPSDLHGAGRRQLPIRRLQRAAPQPGWRDRQRRQP
jgi:subtilisin family serine protease